MQNNTEKFDVVVVGGGAAGMLAAAKAAEKGAKVAILEKNKALGKKLLITGKGRCNITQVRDNKRDFLLRLGKKGAFLASALNVFGPLEMVGLLNNLGLKTKTERGGRVFPASDKSVDVVRTLLSYLLKNKVNVKCGEEVLGFELEEGRIKSLKLKNKIIEAKNFILCTGGKSYPTTGSTGDGYIWAKEMGHTLVKPRPALVPVRVKEDWIEKLEGLSLKNVRLNILKDGKKQGERFGEMLFTDEGLSGPIVIDAAAEIGQLLEEGPVFLELDLKPALDFSKLDQRLQRDFAANPGKDFRNYLPELLPKKMIEVFLELSHIEPHTKLNTLTKEQRRSLVHLLKGIQLEVQELLGFDRAVVTSGGVNLREVDSKTMRSRKVENLYLAGEILDIEGPTGGYNLQISWSTGYAAGKWAGEEASSKA